MLGAIIGDIVGSRLEFANTHRTDFELLAKGCDYTDDTICTIAIANVLPREAGFVDTLQTWCRCYPHPKDAYDERFHQWIYTTPPVPYRSSGNGSVMHVSPYGWLPTRDAILSQAKASAECTYNHPEGIKRAVAIAEAVYLLRGGTSKTDLRKHLEDTYHYDLTQSVDYIREHNSFDETCQMTVPQAIVCFLAGRTFEKVTHLAISIGGDNNTIGTISGSPAEVHFGIPPEIQRRTLTYLPEDMRQIIDSFRQTIRQDEYIEPSIDKILSRLLLYIYVPDRSERRILKGGLCSPRRRFLLAHERTKILH